jgi:hypothetical protein
MMTSYHTPINQRYARLSSDLQTIKPDSIAAFLSLIQPRLSLLSVTDGRLHRKLEQRVNLKSYADRPSV